MSVVSQEPLARVTGDLTPAELRELFVIECGVLTCGALRLKPRQKQFALLLAMDSHRLGSASGEVGVSRPVRGVAQSGSWCARLRPDWRPSEIWDMLVDWRRSGWLALDGGEGRFLLAPDQLPGWADAVRVLGAECQFFLELETGEDVPKLLAKFSQARAKYAAEISQPFSEVARFSQPLGTPGEPGVPVQRSETFKRFTSKRLNVQTVSPEVPVVLQEVAKFSQPRPAPQRTERGECENFATSLHDRVRRFVGAADWQSERWWNGGRGYRAQFFRGAEAVLLREVLEYCEAGLASGEVVVKKSKGAYLWWEFQERRRVEAAKIT